MLQRGFTLIEMVLTMVVIAIITLGVSSYLQLGADGYVDTVIRERQQGEARFAMERISREVRHAVPNSLSVSPDNKCLTFVPIKQHGFYFDFTNLTNQLNVVKPSGSSAGNVGDRLIINPSHSDDFFPPVANKVDALAQSARIEQQSTNSYTLKTTRIPTFASLSSGERFYTYDRRITFCFTGTELTRNGLIWESQQSENEAVMAKNLNRVKSSFNLSSASLSRSALVQITMVIGNRKEEESQFSHDVQVLNVP